MVASSDLIDFVSQMGGEKNLRVEENLGAGFVRLRVAEAERRQAKHDIQQVEDIIVEMLRNSRDAGAKHIFVATGRDKDIRTITILDDGSGIPSHMQEKIFDARVTSKLESMHMDKWGVHGRGMALYSIKENVDQVKVMSSDTGLGASIRVLVDTNRLSEKVDQSTWPCVGKDDNKEPLVTKGPHNIIRTCCEFALEEKSSVSVYLGSAAEIIAALRRFIRPSLDEAALLFIDSLDSLPVLERFYVAADASELMRCASGCGLDISERTAHRILAGQVKPAVQVAHKLLNVKDNDTEIDLLTDRRGLKLSVQDTKQFSLMMERAFKYIQDRYYVDLASDPKVRVSKNKVTVTFEIDKHD